MELWKTRRDSWSYLNEVHPQRLAVFSELFGLVDRCISEYETHASDNTYARICGLTLVKAKNLALGSFSLLLDGLGQEAGALLRPMIEYVELLTYFRHYPDKVKSAAENDLPKAGERAKAINGMYQELRQHLNEHASHSSYSHYSLSHLLTKEFGFRKEQQFLPKVLDKNGTDLAVQLWFVLHEAALTLQPILSKKAMEGLAMEADELKVRMMDVFELKDT